MSLPGFEGEEGLSLKAQRLLPKFTERLMLRTADNPVLSRTIELGMRIGGVTVREMVSHLRVEGNPVGSSGKGYFWASKPEELQETVDHLRARITRMEHVMSGLDRCFQDDNQLSLLQEDDNAGTKERT